GKRAAARARRYRPLCRRERTTPGARPGRCGSRPHAQCTDERARQGLPQQQAQKPARSRPPRRARGADRRGEAEPARRRPAAFAPAPRDLVGDGYASKLGGSANQQGKYMNRRELLQAGAALAAAGWPAWQLLAAGSQGGELKHLARPEKFDYAWLKGHARHLAAQAYAAPVQKLPAAVEALDWDEYQAIRYREEHALWAPATGAKASARGASKFRAKFFHLGLYFHEPVKIYEVENGLAQEIAYDPGMFDYGKSGLDGKSLPED